MGIQYFYRDIPNILLGNTRHCGHARLPTDTYHATIRILAIWVSGKLHNLLFLLLDFMKT